jgi:cathepsin X
MLMFCVDLSLSCLIFAINSLIYFLIYHGKPYDTCQSYIACSSDSQEGFCPFVDTTCHPANICKTCYRNTTSGTNECSPVTNFPFATVSEYGTYDLEDVNTIMAEIFVRGPVKTAVNGTAIKDYQGGIIADLSLSNSGHNHGVSIIGWGLDSITHQRFWIVRNSWGATWGEMGFMRVLMGKNILGIENSVAWSTPGTITTQKKNNCLNEGGEVYTSSLLSYIDPSKTMDKVSRRLKR